MQKCDYEKDRALAEIYTLLLIAYGNYKSQGTTKSEYEMVKRSCLYDKNFFNEYLLLCKTKPTLLSFADPDKMAIDVLNELADAGAITTFEYYTQKERHLLY